MSFLKKSALLIMIPILFVTAVRAAEGDKSLSEYWREAGLSFLSLKNGLPTPAAIPIPFIFWDVSKR